MKLSVCEFPDETSRQDAAWNELARWLDANPTDVLVLPEMPFCAWDMFMSEKIDRGAWRAALTAHDLMIGRFPELNARTILGSRPLEKQGTRYNEGFWWTRQDGYRGVRSKYYLPDEPDGRESTWFARGDPAFSPTPIGPVKVGFQICTELFFTEPSREIARGGGHLIAAPRATGGHRRWPTAAAMAAIVSGCFVASSNRRSFDSDAFAGRSWIVSPDGETLAETTAQRPCVTVEIDPKDADRAKQTYPRNLVV
jgi:N-carbamoylputrescine amidase